MPQLHDSMNTVFPLNNIPMGETDFSFLKHANNDFLSLELAQTIHKSQINKFVCTHVACFTWHTCKSFLKVFRCKVAVFAVSLNPGKITLGAIYSFVFIIWVWAPFDAFSLCRRLWFGDRGLTFPHNTLYTVCQDHIAFAQHITVFLTLLYNIRFPPGCSCLWTFVRRSVVPNHVGFSWCPII